MPYLSWKALQELVWVSNGLALRWPFGHGRNRSPARSVSASEAPRRPSACAADALAAVRAIASSANALHRPVTRRSRSRRCAFPGHRKGRERPVAPDQQAGLLLDVVHRFLRRHSTLREASVSSRPAAGSASTSTLPGRPAVRSAECRASRWRPGPGTSTSAASTSPATPPSATSRRR